MSINSRNGNTLLESGFFAPCRAATTAAVALSGLQTIDGVVLVDGDRVLVKNQVDTTTNGIYAASSGSWSRTTDAAGNAQFFLGMAVIVAQGTVSAGLTYICTATDDPVVIGTSAISFAVQSAVQQGLQQATSTTSAALTVGSKTFTTQAGKNFSAKQWLLIYSAANPDNLLLAEITSYTTTSLVVSVAAVAGSGGPYTDWSIVLTNTPPAAGRQPPIGTGNVTGPGSSTTGHIATFADTTGKVLADGGVLGALAQLTATQATAVLDLFTSLARGLVPLSGGGTANFLRADGSWAVPTGQTPSGTLVTVTAYTTTQTVTIPANASKAIVRLWGGAGGGAGSAVSIAASGAGGGYLEKLLTGLTAGNTLALTIGGAGTAGGGGSGGNGGASSLASGTQTIGTLTANGGAGGTTNYGTGTKSQGGTASGGDVNIQGQDGMPTAWDNPNTATLSVPGGMTGGGRGRGGYVAGKNAVMASTAGDPGGCIIEWFS